MEELVRQLVPSHDPLVCMMDGMTPCPGCQAHIDQQRLKEWQEHRDRNNN